MKKLAILGVLLSILCAQPTAAKADNWGVGVKLGVSENDPKTMKEFQDTMPYNTKLTEGYGVFGVEALYEWTLNEEANKLGVKVGLDVYGDNELIIGGVGAIQESTYAIPLTVYYKRDNGVKGWSPFVGAGVSFFRTEFETVLTATSKEHKNKAVPHLVAGAEYRFTDLFALGVEVKYVFNAKMEKESLVLSDRTGFSGAITGRFYFQLVGILVLQGLALLSAQALFV